MDVPLLKLFDNASLRSSLSFKSTTFVFRGREPVGEFPGTPLDISAESASREWLPLMGSAAR
ncbi:hypothetical protein GCM10009689_14810 [Brevibacterium antiquum]